MAATSTNKQPLLVDHVLHTVVDLAGATVSAGGGVEISSTNSNGAALIIDSTAADGCIIECMYAISRGAEYTIKLFLSSANDYLRKQQGVFIGQFDCGTTEGEPTPFQNMPLILAPVPASGTTISQFQALYIPKGKALWAAVEEAAAGDKATEAPLLGVQGGWY